MEKMAPSIGIFHLLIFVIAVSLTTAQQTIVTVTVPPSAQPTSPSYATPGEYKSQILGYTNLYRAEYNASALTWNTTLAQFAQQWSKRCVFEHSVRSVPPRSSISLFPVMIPLTDPVIG
jgi:hypothetical protein